MTTTATLNRLLPDSLPKPRKAKATKPTQPKPSDTDRMTRLWALAGAYGTLGISALLNGYSYAQASPVPIAAWALGLSIPALVMVLSKVASLQFKRKDKRLAGATGAIGLAVLILSISHCAHAIAALTGTGEGMAVLMAVGIDAGLVACEVAAVRAEKK